MGQSAVCLTLFAIVPLAGPELSNLVDGHDVHPDVFVEPTPEDYIGGSDNVLVKAQKRLQRVDGVDCEFQMLSRPHSRGQLNGAVLVAQRGESSIADHSGSLIRTQAAPLTPILHRAWLR